VPFPLTPFRSPPLGPPGKAPTPPPFPLAVDDFLARFPEFAGADLSLIDAMLNDAFFEIDPLVFGPLAGSGHGYLTAHKLALSPFGQNARLEAKDGMTTYYVHFRQLVAKVSGGFRAL
jgi:hypothetical protein